MLWARSHFFNFQMSDICCHNTAYPPPSGLPRRSVVSTTIGTFRSVSQLFAHSPISPFYSAFEKSDKEGVFFMAVSPEVGKRNVFFFFWRNEWLNAIRSFIVTRSWWCSSEILITTVIADSCSATEWSLFHFVQEQTCGPRCPVCLVLMTVLFGSVLSFF